MDAIDQQLVALLRENARLSYADLARKVGLSAPAVHDRVAKLENSGVIIAYRAIVAPAAIGLGVTALIGILTDNRNPDDVVVSLHEIPEVESCYFLAGEESFLVKVRVGDIGDLEEMIVRLQRISGVARTRTTIALSTKWENRPPAGR